MGSLVGQAVPDGRDSRPSGTAWPTRT